MFFIALGPPFRV
uniref:Uncharacterized protein n=1 Tax=Arundo donax TaxID=35708 RepID=A0A0A8XVC3_ARUDO